MIAAIDHNHKCVWGIGNTIAECKADTSIQIERHFRFNANNIKRQEIKLDYIETDLDVSEAEKYFGDDLYPLALQKAVSAPPHPEQLALI